MPRRASRSVKSGAYSCGRGRITPMSSKGTPRAASRSRTRAMARTSAASPGAVRSSTESSGSAPPARRLEQAGLHARERGRRRRRRERRQLGLRPIDLADPVCGRPAREARRPGARAAGRAPIRRTGKRAASAATRRRSTASSSRSSTTRISAPSSQRASAEVLAGGAEESRVIGEAALRCARGTRGRARPVRAAARGPPGSRPHRPRCSRRVGIDFRAAELGEGARERDRPRGARGTSGASVEPMRRLREGAPRRGRRGRHPRRSRPRPSSAGSATARARSVRVSG